MQQLTVNLSDRSYPIYIAKDLISQSELFQRHIIGRHVLIVSNETVAPIYLQQVYDSCTQSANKKVQIDTLILQDGEKYKTIEVLNDVFDRLIDKCHPRNTTIVALGGGVIGDIVGFAAACYQRGVNFIQVPTSLLAQVDASVGGKTAVNHRLAKNMIGAFHQPTCVIIDINTLSSLPNREFCSGLAEVIKYGLIYDFNFFCWLEDNLDKLMAHDEDALHYAIKHSCLIKAQIVSEDEHEHTGVRILLNLGHTFGHAIEGWAAYSQDWLHGEAVSVGICLAAKLSKRMGNLTSNEVLRITQLLQRANLPVASPSSMMCDDYLARMARDKKIVDNLMRFILLKSIGEAYCCEQVTVNLIKEIIEDNNNG